MRRPHREIEIFSMSVLDMFASALGAFIMVTIILYPYYKVDMKAQLTAERDAVEARTHELQSDNDSLEQQRQRNVAQQRQVEAVHEEDNQLRRCRQDLAVCVSDLAQTFLMVMMQWDDPVDVDLVVTDPAGHEFNWENNNRAKRHFPDTDAQLSFDVTTGPGIEVWLSPVVGPGDYKVDYQLNRKFGRTVKVSGYYLDRTGRKALPSKTLSDSDMRLHAATLHLGPDGKFILER